MLRANVNQNLPQTFTINISMTSMRPLIQIVEASVQPRPRPWKAFNEITISDMFAAVMGDEDLFKAYEIIYDAAVEAGEEESLGEFKSLGPEAFAQRFSHNFEQGKDVIAPFAQKSEIEVFRGFDRLVDVSQPLGPHWSVADHVYEAYGDHRLRAVVSTQQVDWAGSIARAPMWWEEDFELTLIPGVRIKLVDIYFGDAGRAGLI